RTDLFSYTVPSHPFVDMSWLFQVWIATLFAAGGLALVGFFRVVMVVVTVLLLWLTARERGVRSPELRAVGFTLGRGAWETRFFLRPELVTYVLVALESYMIHRHARGGRDAWLYGMLPIQVLWANTHQLAILGPALLGLHAASRMFGGARYSARAAWIAFLLALAALLVNPYGRAGLATVWGLRTRFEQSNVFAQTISELASPFSADTAHSWPTLAFGALVIGTGLCVLVRPTRLRPFDIGVTALFLYLGVTAKRNMGVLVVATLPVTLEAAQGILDRFARPTPALRTRSAALRH